ncbi:MAG: shikimate dehydrogenase [Chloroflexaceae bacterium]|nr:shikimate dehydrogenase [Chloroflexaceae bacterium]
MTRSLAGLIGDPVEHSRSPVIQHAAFAYIGMTADYELWHTPAAELEQRIAFLREPHVLGANVTLPHKQAVMPFLDSLETGAQQIGAVNTIYKRSGGHLIGANTDAPALLATLREEAHFNPTGQRVVLLGASGAARASAWSLVDSGIAQLVVANRTLDHAEQLLADLMDTADGVDRYQPTLIALALDDPSLNDCIAESQLLINATAVGWQSGETPLAHPSVHEGILVFDMVYRQTRLLAEAAQQGAPTLNGLGMLIRQGSLAFTRWTGHKVPFEVMHNALLAV